jgi:hypothetical protein
MFQRGCLRPLLAALVGSLLAMPGLARAGGEKEVEQLKKQVKDLQKEVQALRERLEALEKAKPGPFPGFPAIPPGIGGPAFPGPGLGGFPGLKPVTAKVTKIDKDKGTVVLEIGADSGLKSGQTVMVVRKGPQQAPPTMIRLTEVKDKEAKGELQKLPFPQPPGAPEAATLEVNDEVQLMPIPAGFGGPGFPGGPRPPVPPPPPPG